MERIIKKYMERIGRNIQEVKLPGGAVYVYTCEVCLKPIVGKTISEVSLNGARHLMSHKRRL